MHSSLDYRNMELPTRLKGEKYWVPTSINEAGDRLIIKAAYNKTVITELKAMAGARWNPDNKSWSVLNNRRNWFQLAFMAGEDVYGWYDRPLVAVERRPQKHMDRPGVYDELMPYDHQWDMVRHGLTYHYGIWAAEMGTGKSLSAILVMMLAGLKNHDCLYVGPKSALASFQLQLREWCAEVIPECITYEGLRKLVEHWPKGKPAPKLVIYDESSRLKNPTSQRSQAAYHLAEAIRDEWGNDGYVILMSGSPAPKSPADWWWQAEIACPGFIKEGTIEKFKARLGLIVMKEAFATGGSYPHLITWKDDENKCAKCGQLYGHEDHKPASELEQLCGKGKGYHDYEKSTNEVSYLYERLKGLVEVKFKKDCFSGNDRLLTDKGPMTFREAAQAGWQNLYVRTDAGFQWLRCEVKSFGHQKTYPIRFGDGHTYRTTKGHRWLTMDRGKIEKRWRHTYELLPGKTQLPLSPVALPEQDDDFWEGMAHGFVFGDGHNYQNNPGDPSASQVALFGHDADLKSLLLKFGTLSYRWQDWRYVDVVCNLPKPWKAIPTTPSRSYACGFVLGLLQADGSVAETEARIYQADKSDLRRVEGLAIFAGFRTLPIRLARLESPFDGSEKPLWSLGLQTCNLDVSYLLRRDYKESLKIRSRDSATTVSWIGYEEERIEETFCAVVPHWQNFTLANGVNCLNCLDLPDKRFRIIRCQPSQATLNAAKLIVAGASTTIAGLTLLRELSDGFQYQDTPIGDVTCGRCKGAKLVEMPIPIVDQDEIDAAMQELMDKAGEDFGIDAEGMPIPEHMLLADKYRIEYVPCPTCGGAGVITGYKTEAIQVPCPKEDVMKDILDSHEEDGRLVTYAGFQGSIDRNIELCRKMSWNYIRVDGRGWHTDLPGMRSSLDMLTAFQKRQAEFPRVNFVGHPGSAGLGLTLTASCEIVYYSLDFNAESYVQSQDRIHRAGMDVSRGALITHIFHLPSDEKVHENLTKKLRLQEQSLGQFRDAFANFSAESWTRRT